MMFGKKDKLKVYLEDLESVAHMGATRKSVAENPDLVSTLQNIINGISTEQEKILGKKPSKEYTELYLDEIVDAFDKSIDESIDRIRNGK